MGGRLRMISYLVQRAPFPVVGGTAIWEQLPTMSPNAILYTYPVSLAHGAMALLLGKCNIRLSSSLVGFHETLSAVYAPLPV